MVSSKYISVFGTFAALAATGFAASMAFATDGKTVYNANCAVCHNALPPKLGDKVAWEPRIKQGVEVLVSAVLKGKGTMPPKAGKPTLSEEDIRAAVEYLIIQSK